MRNIRKRERGDAEASKLEELILTIGRRQSLRLPLNTECEDLGLTPPQIHALMWVGHEGPLTMGELARRLGITEKTITGIADRLERAGMLQRERDGQDRRIVRTRLTARGVRAFDSFHRHLFEQIEQFLELLDADDRRALFRILEKLRDRIGAGAPTRSPKEAS